MALGGAAALAAPAPSLAQLAAAAGLRFGSSSDAAIATAPAAYAAAMAAQCSLFAPNLGWRRTEAAVEPGWEDPDIAFARRHGMGLTGGHLLWHEQLPPAFLAAAAGPPAQAAADKHIQQLAGHYAGQVWSWNVVNEAIDTQAGDADGMRRSPLSEKLGPGYIAAAFHAARAADPAALLAYNDSQLEMATPLHAARRGALLRLLDRLGRQGAPIGAVGLQTHLRLDGTPFDPAAYRAFLADIAGRGLRILITEMDVFDIGVPGTLAQRDAAVASRYGDVLAVALDQPAMASLVTWGLSDRYTWLTPATNPAYRRPDGQPARPLPLDDAFQPKPAFAAIASCLRQAPRRA